jgi:hypothetical protein
MNKSDADIPQFGPLTMVDAGGARGNQASDVPRDDIIFDAAKLVQFEGALYKLIAEHKIASSIVCGTWCHLFVSLTGQRRNHFWR